MAFQSIFGGTTMILILLPGYLSLNIILGSLYLSLSNSKCFLNLLPHKQGQNQLLVIVKEELGLTIDTMI